MCLGSSRGEFAESAVVQTKSIHSDDFSRPLSSAVFARDDPAEGRQGASATGALVDIKRVRRRARAAGRALSWRDQLLAELAWRKSIEVLEDGAAQPAALLAVPEDRCEGLLPDDTIVRLRLSQLRLSRPRQWGACWPNCCGCGNGCRSIGFWEDRLPATRKGTRWDLALFVLVAYRLIAPGSGGSPGTGIGKRSGRPSGRGWIGLSPVVHPAVEGSLCSIEPSGLGGATGRARSPWCMHFSPVAVVERCDRQTRSV